MIEPTIQFAIDVEESLPMRRLAGAIRKERREDSGEKIETGEAPVSPPTRYPLSYTYQSEAESQRAAVFLVFRLYKELAYRARNGDVPGRLLCSEEALLVEALGSPDIADPVAVLMKAGFLRAAPTPDGDPAWLCEGFARLNAGLAPSARTRDQRGGDGKRFHSRQGKAEARLEGDLLLVPEVFWVDDAGAKLSPEECRRAMRLIRGVDNALYQAERKPHDFTPGLVVNAVELLRRHADAEVDQWLRKLMLNREHPALAGWSAEKLLPEMARKVG